MDSHCIWQSGKSCVSPVFHLQSFLPPDSSNPPPGKLDDSSSLDLSREVKQARSQVADEGGRHLLVGDRVRHVPCLDQDWHPTKLSHLGNEESEVCFLVF